MCRAMSAYRLRYLDRSRKFIRADRVHANDDAEAIALASRRALAVRSELWRGGVFIAGFPAAINRHASERA